MGGSTQVRVRVIGTAEVMLDGSPVLFDTRKALGILAYLLVEGSASRDTLTGLFWADSTQERARATLRRTLSSLRSGIGGEAVRTSRHLVELGDVCADVFEFETRLSAVEGHDHDSTQVCQACIEPLTEATALYRGDFLQGVAIRDAPYFEDWQRRVTESLRHRAGDGLRRLASALAASGDYVGAVAAVERWIDLDPLHEPAHRQLMLLRAWSGDRPGAIDAYREFVTILDRELAVTPLEETTGLYEAILDEDLPPAPGVPRAVMPADRTMSPAGGFLGRSEELRRLDALLAAARDGAHAVCVTGKAWMGKTRLLEELTGSAVDRIVLSGRARRTEATLPYGVMAQLLGSANPAVLGRRLPDWVLGEVGRIVPHFGAPALDTGDPLGEIRLLEALRTVIVEIATTKPLLITIDDVQWIDRASARALAYMLPRIGPSPTLLVVSRSFGELLSEETRDLISGLETIELEPLQVEELPEELGDPVEVMAATGGIPILVSEHLAGRSDSDMVDRYLSQRLEGLSELGRQMLGVASVVVGSCSHEMLHAVSGRSEAEVVDALDELIVAGVLREHPGAEDYVLAIDGAAQLTYESLTLARRRLLHRRAGEKLSEQPRAATDVRKAALVADHFKRAGDRRAGNWYRTAGDTARRSFANQEAVEFYETALALDTDDACEAQISLAEVQMTLGEYAQALSSLDVAAGRCEAFKRGRVDHLTGEVHRIMGRFELAADHFDRAVASHPEPARVYADWALLEHRGGDTSKARELGRRALEVLVGAGDESAGSRVHNVNGVISQNHEEALHHLNLAAELADGDEVALMAALNNKARVIADGGDLDAAIPLVTDAIALAAKTGHRHREAALRDFLADLHHRSGDTETARAIQTEAMSLFADIDTGAIEPEIWLLSRW